MGDKSLIYGYNSETKQTIIAVEEPTITKSKKGAAGALFNKGLLIVFFDVKGTVHCEFVPPNSTVQLLTFTL
jgi:hypothetical protein